MSNTKVKARPNPTKAVEIVSQSELRMRIIKAGVKGDAAIRKVLSSTEVRSRDGQPVRMAAVTTAKKIHTKDGTNEVFTSTSTRKISNLPAQSLQDGLIREKSFKGIAVETGGKKAKVHVFLSFVRKNAETKELLDTPIPMISINGSKRVPFQKQHEIQFNVSMA